MSDRISRLMLAAAMFFAAATFGRAVLPVEPAAAQSGNPFYRADVLSSALVVTADTATAASDGWAAASIIGGILTCTEDSGTATLDVAVQRTLDGGVHWANVITYTQLSATGTETKFYADVQAASAQMIGDVLRVNYDIGGTGQYTCDFALAGTSN